VDGVRFQVSGEAGRWKFFDLVNRNPMLARKFGSTTIKSKVNNQESYNLTHDLTQNKKELKQ